MRKLNQLKTSHLAKYSTIAALSLTLAACGGGGSNNDTNTPTPKPNPGSGQTTISSIGFNQALLTSSANPSEAKTLVTIDAQSIKVNNAAATAEQFKNLTLSLDGANKDLFTLDKTDTNATLRFNKDANKIAKNTCTDNVCKAIVKAVLSSKQAQLNANVSITYPVINSIALTQVGQVSVVSNKSKQLASFNKDDFKVNGQASTAEQFKAATFSLTGDNASLFTLSKTETSLTLTFNQDKDDIAKNFCTNNVCTASITATLEGKTANVESRVTLIFLPKIKISDLALPASHYFMMPGSGYCLRPRGTETTNQAGTRIQENVCLSDTPAIYKDLKPAIPLVLLLVRDEGQTCIVTNADHSCADANVTAYTATLQQRQAYLNKYALTANELEALNASIIGYANKINNQTVSKPACQNVVDDIYATAFSSCKFFVNKPNNPVKDTSQPSGSRYNYDINGRFSVVVKQTNYFDANGTLAKNIQYIDSLNTEAADVLKNGTDEQKKTNFARFFAKEIRGVNVTRPPWSNPNFPGYRIIKNNIYPDFKEHLLENHPYKAHQALFSTRYQNIKQPMLVLNNDYPRKAIKFTSALLTSGQTPAYGDSLGPMKLTVKSQVQSGLVEGDRMVHTLYPLALSVQGKNTLSLNVGIVSMPQELEHKLKDGVPVDSGKPTFEITKYNYSNPFKRATGHCGHNDDKNLIGHLREVVQDIPHYASEAACTAAIRKNYAMDAASMPIYFGFDYVSLKEHLK